MVRFFGRKDELEEQRGMLSEIKNSARYKAVMVAVLAGTIALGGASIAQAKVWKEEELPPQVETDEIAQQNQGRGHLSPGYVPPDYERMEREQAEAMRKYNEFKKRLKVPQNDDRER